MNKLKGIIKFILASWFGFWVLVGFTLLYPAFLITLSNPNWHKTAHRLRRIWGHWNFFWGAIWVKQIVEEPSYNSDNAYIITPNHTSQLDIVTLTVKLNLDFSFMAKIELARIPVFGIFFKTIDIAVDRKNARQSAAAYQKAKNLLDNHKSLVIFPEATIRYEVPKLGRFKDGAFKLAIEKQVDILPVTIIGNWLLLPDKGKFHFRPGSVTQFVHSPISTKGLTDNDVESLKQKVYSIIESKLAEYGFFE
ncbi:MAG: lysophospholipid acyltransferase family protein [Bacteroidia bacterium]